MATMQEEMARVDYAECNDWEKQFYDDQKNGSYTPPSFSHSNKLTTVLNSGKGNQWYGYNVVKEGQVKDAALYERAKKFYTSLSGK